MSGKPNAPTIFRVSDLPQNRDTPFELRPDTATLEKIAGELGLLGLRKLLFRGVLSASGASDWTLRGQLGATVTQPCVLTLAPVTTRIEVDVERHFLAEMPELGDDEEVEMPDDENAEPLRATIDLGLVMTESLALNLPLYPRADGAALDETAFTEPGKQAMTDEDARPFAGLASLRDKLAGEDEK